MRTVGLQRDTSAPRKWRAVSRLQRRPPWPTTTHALGTMGADRASTALGHAAAETVAYLGPATSPGRATRPGQCAHRSRQKGRSASIACGRSGGHDEFATWRTGRRRSLHSAGAPSKDSSPEPGGGRSPALCGSLSSTISWYEKALITAGRDPARRRHHSWKSCFLFRLVNRTETGMEAASSCRGCRT